MRRDCQPHFVDADGACRKLSRVDFTDRAIGESFLQEELHRNPELLPVEEIDDSFAPLLSLGREIRAIDNLFISPSGRLTIVETKLWRNPEATRQVVAQVLDYAQRLSALSYEEFEKICRSAMQPAPLAEGKLFNLVSTRFPDQVMSERDFTDAVQRNLRNARFMLLVVGDGIRENLEDMLGLLHQQPQMLFTLGLVEMQIYECDALQGRLIVPQLVARTNEIVRAVVRVENPANMAVSVSLPPEPKEKGTTLSEQEFLDSVDDTQTKDVYTRLITFAKSIGRVSFATRSLCVRYPYAGTGELRLFRLFGARKKRGRIKIIAIDKQLKKRGLDDALAWNFAQELDALIPEVEIKPDRPEPSRLLTIPEVEGHLDDFMNLYRSLTDQLNALTPTNAPEGEESEDEEESNNGIDGDEE